MKRKIIALIIAVIMIVMLCSCVEGDRVEDRNDTKYQIWLNNSGKLSVYSFKDEETGVWYISNGKDIIPRLCPDGSLYVD